ncbi:MAG: response regulator [Calditerrivibrio sp.]|nr:response regulator [Calditerrivibrio sp.]MCA1932241.1 response regulator [Calditerrivibrio sp.]
MAKILVADDSITEREFIRKVLSNSGYDVTVVESGEKAIEKIKDEKFSCILLDVVMPGKNGFQICRDIKKDEFSKDIPVILITSKGQESDKFWGMKQGADEYLVKPVSEDQILEVVKRFVK